MKILVFGSTFPSGDLDGSRPRFIYDLAEALSAHAEVLALVPHHPGAAVRERMGSVNVERYRYWWPTSAETLTPNMRQRMQVSLLAKLQVPTFLGAQAWSLRRTVRRHSVDVVNAHWLIPQGLTAAAVRALPESDFRLAVHVHAGDVYMLSNMPFGGTIARYVMARTERVFADGSHVRDTLDDLLGYKSRARLQPMGVDGELFRTSSAGEPPEAREFTDGFVLFVGRFVEKKGVPYLIRAFPQLLKCHPDLGLVLVGSGPEESALRKEVSMLGLENRVRFAGHRPHEDVVTYLRHCRVAAVPSIVDSRGETEGMPTVVLEAMTMGVPVVGSAVDGIPDVIRHAENGWLCRQKDPDDLAEKLLNALSEREDSPIVRAAERTAERFEWSRIGRNYVEALRA